jgi:hypothetical protein
VLAGETLPKHARKEAELDGGCGAAKATGRIGSFGDALFVTKNLRRQCDIPTNATASSRLYQCRLGWVRAPRSGRCEMRHLLLATTMLVVALMITFGAASALQSVAEARNGVQSDPFEVAEIAKPAMTPANVK